MYYTDLPRVFLQKTAYLFIQHKMRTDRASIQTQPKAFKLQFPISPSHLISLKSKPYDILTFFSVQLKCEKSLNDTCTGADALSGGLEKSQMPGSALSFSGGICFQFSGGKTSAHFISFFPAAAILTFSINLGEIEERSPKSPTVTARTRERSSDSDPVDIQSITIN